MTSKLLVAYPDIPARALVETSGLTYDDDTPARASIMGMRHCLSQLATATTTTDYVQYDLGNGVTATAQYFIIARADILKTQGVTTVKLKAHSGPRVGTTTGTEIFSNTDFQNATLIGPTAQDFIFTSATASAAYRYWWVEFQTSIAPAACKYGRSKLYFGSWFDAGVDPNGYSYAMAEDNPGGLVFPTGGYRMSRVDQMRFAYVMDWQMVDDANAQAFCDKILSDPLRRYVFLYSSGNDQILADQKLVHCKVNAEQCGISRMKKANCNYVHGVFEQVAG